MTAECTIILVYLYEHADFSLLDLSSLFISSVIHSLRVNELKLYHRTEGNK